MSNAMQWSSYTPTRWKIVGRMNKIRDLFKVKLYTIRSETKRLREREREREREKKK